jgi:fluoroacetyl-CoA thioesterase
MAGKEDLRPGLRHSESVVVSRDLTVPEISSAYAGLADMPPVFATAYLLAFVEWTCLEAVKPYLEPGERTVGTSIDMRHTAATPIGMKVTATAELTAVNGRMLEFSFTCRDAVEEIGRGKHGRAIIGLDRFMDKVSRKG